MINPNQDTLISRLTVRLREESTKAVIGTGLIYYSDDLRDNVYLITASHCLHHDGDSFQELLSSVIVDMYNPSEDKYVSIKVNHINKNLLFKDAGKDLAVLPLNKSDVESIIGDIPRVRVVTTRQNKTQFIVKGFPNATMGKELDVIFPTWKQELTTTRNFQLQLNEDYNDYATEGFSGSGIFLNDNEYVYLFGIFTRFRPEDRGRVIYGQHIELVNDLLFKNYLPSIRFDYLGDNNLNHSFFKNNVEKAIHNLGQRYSKELNLELPISKLFNDLIRDKDFEHRFLQAIDNWINENRYSSPKEESVLFNIQTEQYNLKTKVTNWIESISINVPNVIDCTWIINEINRISDLINERQSELYELQREKIKAEKDTKKPYNYRTPYEAELNTLRELQAKNRRMEDDLQNKVNVKLTNYPVLILKGEAGSGKSHLLGDIAQNRMDRGRPTVLLLGQHFKPGVGSVEKNILDLLGLEMNMDDFLKSLNKVGDQLNERIPILIDALNEGGGVDLWRDEVFGLLNNVSKYPYIGVVLSIRTTYFDLMFPESIPQEISIVNHEGFAGNEYTALKLFCEHYELKQPDFPILAPEFTKPLFLILICKGVQNSPSKEFPQGFQGIGTIFSYYVKALESQFQKLREEYHLAPNLISIAIQKFSLECFSKNESVLLLEEAQTFFNTNFPQYPSLLKDMIQESVFIRNCRENYNTGEKEEVIYFAYERFGDHFIANELIKDFKDQQEVLRAFGKEEKLGKLIEEHHWKYGGVLESLAILLPEKHGLELFEVYSWLYEDVKKDDFGLKNTIDWQNGFLLDSLKWRSIESINEEKLIEWFQGDFFYFDYDRILLTIEELATIKNHPFNSDRLHRILLKTPMPERDSFWQHHALWYSGHNDNEIGFPLRRLIDWAWSSSISSSVDSHTALLAAQTLSWMLASTNRKLRDEVTKAIVNLLEQQPKALLDLLTKFSEADDMYIQERLYAIAYGCILRTEYEESIQLIGNYIYNKVFKKGNPPEHVLLRDYARNTVEYMIYRGLGEEIDTEKIRPPYKSKLPTYPTEEEISIYDIDYENPEYDKEFIRTHNKIHFSVMSWDFGRKTVEPDIRKFCPVSFTTEDEYTKFINDELSKEQQDHLSSLVDMIYSKELHESKSSKYDVERLGGQERYDSLLKEYEQVVEKGFEILKSMFNGKSEYVIKNILPYLQNVKRLNTTSYNRRPFDTRPVKRWIVKRAHELGYDVKLHGRYDQSSGSYGQSRPGVERIGEKYQWIAFHEILSILSDNHKISEWYSDKNYQYYQGAWQFYARDIDPVYTTKNPEELPEDDMMILEKEYKWWHAPEYSFWNQENQECARNIDDLPEVKHVISKKDDNGVEWLFLNKSAKWMMPKPIGVDKYSMYRKEVFYMINGYIIKRDDKPQIVEFLQDKNLWGGWMPEPRNESNQLLNREKYWSPAYHNAEREEPWVEIYYNHISTGLTVMPAIEDAKSHISDDKSGAESLYNIPCEQLFNDLELIYAPNDGDFVNPQGVLTVQNIPKSDGLMINKETLLDYLKKNDLDIIWTLLGEKMAYISHGEQSYFGAPCGVFHLENGEVKGQLNHYERD
ncbi:AVAST type 2 anti-phage system protein Avs2 [Rhodohalobacter sp. 8-1]|uniref:AVAST type 2 anti-phage system protein Avs2 n=1 Tax=Rhodohalobacter sp. 8-1 TaxID=3131972 RepID=UPI0030EC6F2B